ncbi:helix-turn-helix transcriptional regulator [Nocardiopsis sp. EMB25]|uniref:helix-turn-helix transcriptional regulator n=1 Tax=Nocardiopsis TaxID=2013 RepID=UPI0003451F07|nr:MULTISPECIES: helix-turn-helix transcriptional regulator [Nocardiopsis]MCY9784419.1 helix-turn-helix transcriptional regulator [Nocardiopsis sp. EMB25]
MRESVRQAVSSIHTRYSEPITLADIAAEVFVSPFHLSRVFAQEVGVPPGKYLTAVRMFEAKKRLIASPMTVCDIVHSVGYNSVGTFTSRFTRAVGMSPRQYRQPEVERLLVAASGGFSRMPPLGELNRVGRRRVGHRHNAGRLSGVIELPRHPPETTVLVGAYQERIPQQAPVVSLALPAHGRTEFALADVPPGDWSVIAIAMPEGTTHNREDVFVGSSPVRVAVHAGADSRTRIPMRRLAPTDAPIAITLADSLPLPVERHPERPPALACG